MTPLFADTFFFLALINPRDAAHAKTVAIAGSMARPILTTAWVLTELADGLAKTPNRNLFQTIRADLQRDDSAVIVPPTSDLYDRGVALYCARADKSWSLTDCISFVVMNDHNMTEALTGDHHFEQAGFVALLK